MSKNKILRIIPIGGLGEVGKNMTLYEYGNNILIVDAGIMFPENDMLGIDYIIPDFEHYLKDKRDQVRGIIFTHGHEDHIGAVQHLLEMVNAPIYATKLTLGLLEVKLNRYGMLAKADLRPVNAGEQISIGPFTVDFFHVCHSIPDGVGLGIETPAGLVVHTGDYKFDHTPVDNWPTDYAKLAEFAQRGVLALLADSTNATEPGWTPSERTIEGALDQVFDAAKGRILVATFASLISRMQQVADAAERHGRKIAFTGRSMVENMNMARTLGYVDFPERLVITLEKSLSMPDNQVVLMCTGSQGEPRSIMGRLANGTNRKFDIREGDTIVLSSQPIPGNEEPVYRTINQLFRRGADVVYEAIAPIHVSGHASQEEIKLLLHLVRPRYLIPIHGELRMLKQHAKLAKEVGMPKENICVVENGQIIELVNGELRLAERIPGDYIFVDGSGVGDVDRSIVRERESLAQDGIVVVNLVIDDQTGQLNGDPQIITRGFILMDEMQPMLDELKKRIQETLRASDGNLEGQVLRAVKSYLYEETKRNPYIVVNINRI
ncbi:MAG TPA: ribonuclease J [Brevefilum sp.]|nr:ribonuclease J [Brevefilum sp.]HPL69425.1 ribonuclease J [Brevefilum sp.]